MTDPSQKCLMIPMTLRPSYSSVKKASPSFQKDYFGKDGHLNTCDAGKMDQAKGKLYQSDKQILSPLLMPQFKGDSG